MLFNFYVTLGVFLSCFIAAPFFPLSLAAFGFDEPEVPAWASSLLSAPATPFELSLEALLLDPEQREQLELLRTCAPPTAAHGRHGVTSTGRIPEWCKNVAFCNTFGY